AALAGCCLLGAGMAQNALADLADDRLRKPERPLPQGDLTPRTVLLWFMGLTAIPLALAFVFPFLWPPVLIIVGLTAAYHWLLKRQRLAGCLALGVLRATSMSLGVVAATQQWPGGIALPACALYGLYITGASLHASTDDEPKGNRASPLGLGLCLATLLTLAGWLLTKHTQPLDLAGPLLLLWAGTRLLSAARRLPPPAVTGTALSGLQLFHGGLVAGLGQPLVGGTILVLFALGRRLLRSFPPS
ncbi:MAG: 4-hydroxybenzoate polyprenyltransferase, partial [Pseudohongiellaceae bacterium]